MKHLLYIFFFFFFLIHFLSFAEASQDSSTQTEALNLNHKPKLDLDLAVSVSDNKAIKEISSSIVNAEIWLKTHVLSLYPSTKITTIVIFFPHHPDSSYYQTTELDLVLSSLKNLHHSLTRWGLEKEIKVSIGFSSSSYQFLNNPKTQEMFKPVFSFLKSINSTFTINPPLNHLNFLKSVEKFGSLSFNKVNFLNTKPQQEQATTTMVNRRRGLHSFTDISSKITVHFPTLPSPSPEENSPIGSPTTNPNSPIGSPTNPNPPIFSQIGSPINPNPPFSSPIGFSFPPTNPNFPISQPPISSPTNPNPPISSPTSSIPPISQPPPINPNPTQPPIPQSSPNLSLPPPCLPSPAAPPPTKQKEGLWCVAKPTVAAETLQQALDFACGEGGADCDEIKSPHGICYYPDTAMAHASYAFNSYWQKTKRNGGTCSFGGTAMLITTDPSYQHCRFILS